MSLPRMLLPVLASCALIIGCADESASGDEVSAASESADEEMYPAEAYADEAGEVTEASEADASSDDLQLVQIVDQRGFGQPIVAGTVEIPSRWAAQGGVEWDRSTDCVSNQLRMRWMAAAPDGRAAFELMPGMSWQVAGTDIPMNPCPPLTIRSAREFLESVAQRYPGARALEYRDRPDLAPEARSEQPGITARSEAGQLLIAYQNGGREVRELLTAALTISQMQNNIVIGVPAVYAQRTLGRSIDTALGERMIASLKPDPAWLENVQRVGRAEVERVSKSQRERIATWHARRMAEINARGMADRAAIRAQTNREVAQIYSNTWANGMATDERIQRRTLEAIGGYNTYADPAGGGVVRESIEYDRVLRNSDGTYISTNDPYLNPAGSEELERVR